MREDLIRQIEALIDSPLPEVCRKWIHSFSIDNHNARDLSFEVHQSIKVKKRGLRKDIEMLILEQIKKERKS